MYTSVCNCVNCLPPSPQDRSVSGVETVRGAREMIVGVASSARTCLGLGVLTRRSNVAL